MDRPVSSSQRETRRAKASLTRARIIAAATVEFTATGYHGTTMAAIATRAGVAVQTVYFVFHTKAELLSSVVDNAVLGETHPTPPEDSEWFQALLADPNPESALRGFIAGGGAILQRAAWAVEVARFAAPTDIDARRIHDHHERLRRDGYRRFVSVLADAAALRGGLDVEQATDILLIVVGPQTYLAFVNDHGWSHKDTINWLSDNIPQLLLASSN